MPVRVVERIRNRDRDSCGFVDRELFFALQSCAQRFSFDERHDVEQKSIGRAGIEQRKKIRMLKIRGNPDLGQKSFDAKDGAQVWIEEFERDVPVVADVAGEIDGGHSTSA